MTKEFYKNPIFYYVAAPVIAAGWMLLVWTVRLPQAQHRWDLGRVEYNKAQKIMTEILDIDPDRLDYTDSRETDSEFDYAIAVEKIASLCRIPSADYKLSSGPTITSGGQRSQRAKMVLRQVDITRFTDFLTKIQFRWAGLQCTQLKLTHKKGLKDKWDVDLDFTYYY